MSNRYYNKSYKKAQVSLPLFFVSIIIIAVIFGVAGFLVGRMSLISSIPSNEYSNVQEKNNVELSDSDIINAYSKGWIYWFSGYGTHNEGVQYMEQYRYGRTYGQSFPSLYSAFEAGYKDAFFLVNNKDPDDRYTTRIEQGFAEYFPNN